MRAELQFSCEQAMLHVYLNHELNELKELDNGKTLEGVLDSFADSAFNPKKFEITLEKVAQCYCFETEPDDIEKRWFTNYRIKIGQGYIDELFKKAASENYDPLNYEFSVSTRFAFGDKVFVFPKDPKILYEQRKKSMPS